MGRNNGKIAIHRTNLTSHTYAWINDLFYILNEGQWVEAEYLEFDFEYSLNVLA